MAAHIQKRYDLALERIRDNDYEGAIGFLEDNIKYGGPTPASLSLLGALIAKSGGNLKKAEKLCKEALKLDSGNAECYLNLAEVYIKRKWHSKLIKTLRAGIETDPENEEIVKLLNQFSTRKKPPIPFLSRSNALNKYLGKLMANYRL
ncbi:MAG: hypothetical protein OEV42_02955 [Deltaproteobacteria bacterium]|nr:hypothetical protein [Deltaproteobacteria bacterium]